jgi:hypothetical protein
VNNFISSNEEEFNKLKGFALESCKNELLTSHSASLFLEKDNRSTSTSEMTFMKLMARESEENLRNCINKNL